MCSLPLCTVTALAKPFPILFAESFRLVVWFFGLGGRFFYTLWSIIRCIESPFSFYNKSKSFQTNGSLTSVQIIIVVHLDRGLSHRFLHYKTVCKIQNYYTIEGRNCIRQLLTIIDITRTHGS